EPAWAAILPRRAPACPSGRRRAAPPVTRRARLHEIEVGVVQHQPLGAGFLEVHLDPRMRPLPFAVQDHAVAELAVAHALPEADAELGAGRGCRPSGGALPCKRGTHELHARTHFLDELRRYLGDEPRGKREAVDAVQAALLRVRQVQALLRPRDPDVTEPPFLFERPGL